MVEDGWAEAASAHPHLLDGTRIATGVECRSCWRRNEISRLIGRPPVSRVASALNVHQDLVAPSS
jgi:hypothetical protein